MCFVPEQSTETGPPPVTLELSATEVRRFIADIDHLRDLRIRLKRLLGWLELAEQLQQQQGSASHQEMGRRMGRAGLPSG
jgi:hypothetical protein